MTEEQFVKAKDLFEVQYSLERAIENAQQAPDWHILIDSFRRAHMQDFLGNFEEVKATFIKQVTAKLDAVNKQIEAI